MAGDGDVRDGIEDGAVAEIGDCTNDGRKSDLVERGTEEKGFLLRTVIVEKRESLIFVA